MKFILTKELGRLAKWLRIFGFDSAYFNSPKVSALKILAFKENRIILTRSHWFEKEKHVKVIMLESENLTEQLRQIIIKLALKIDEFVMFSRCIVCNTLLEQIPKEKIKDKIPEDVYNTQNVFNICPQCKRVYWQGTHRDNVTRVIEEIRDRA